MGKRKYIAISVKHTKDKWKFGDPCVLWGWKQTKDDEPRCFSGYTEYLSKAERYDIDDFKVHGYSSDVIKPEPVQMSVDLCKRWKVFDTVLVEYELYEAYCKLSGLTTEVGGEPYESI